MKYLSFILIILFAGLIVYATVMFKLDKFVSVPIITALAGGMTLFFRNIFKDNSSLILEKLQMQHEENAIQHKEISKQINSISNNLNYLINTKNDLDKYVVRFEKILNDYVDISDNKKLTTYLIAKFKSIKTFAMNIHRKGFYTINGKPIKQDFESVKVAGHYEIHRLNSFGYEQFGEQFKFFLELHAESSLKFLEEIEDLINDKDKNAKHQRLQTLAEKFMRKSFIDLFKWANMYGFNNED